MTENTENIELELDINDLDFEDNPIFADPNGHYFDREDAYIDAEEAYTIANIRADNPNLGRRRHQSQPSRGYSSSPCKFNWKKLAIIGAIFWGITTLLKGVVLLIASIIAIAS